MSVPMSYYSSIVVSLLANFVLLVFDINRCKYNYSTPSQLFPHTMICLFLVNNANIIRTCFCLRLFFIFLTLIFISVFFFFLDYVDYIVG